MWLICREEIKCTVFFVIFLIWDLTDGLVAMMWSLICRGSIKFVAFFVLEISANANLTCEVSNTIPNFFLNDTWLSSSNFIVNLSWKGKFVAASVFWFYNFIPCFAFDPRWPIIHFWHFCNQLYYLYYTFEHLEHVHTITASVTCVAYSLI